MSNPLKSALRAALSEEFPYDPDTIQSVLGGFSKQLAHFERNVSDFEKQAAKLGTSPWWKQELADKDLHKQMAGFERDCTEFVAAAVRAGAFGGREWLNWRILLMKEPEIVNAACLLADEGPKRYQSPKAAHFSEFHEEKTEEEALIVAAQLLADALERMSSKGSPSQGPVMALPTKSKGPALGNNALLPKANAWEAAEILLKFIKKGGKWRSLEDAADIVRRNGKSGGPLANTCVKSTVHAAIQIDDERFQPLRDVAKFKKRSKRPVPQPNPKGIATLMTRLLNHDELPEDVKAILNGPRLEAESWIFKNPHRITGILTNSGERIENENP